MDQQLYQPVDLRVKQLVVDPCVYSFHINESISSGEEEILNASRNSLKSITPSLFKSIVEAKSSNADSVIESSSPTTDDLTDDLTNGKTDPEPFIAAGN